MPDVSYLCVCDVGVLDVKWWWWWWWWLALDHSSNESLSLNFASSMFYWNTRWKFSPSPAFAWISTSCFQFLDESLFLVQRLISNSSVSSSCSPIFLLFKCTIVIVPGQSYDSGCRIQQNTDHRKPWPSRQVGRILGNSMNPVKKNILATFTVLLTFYKQKLYLFRYFFGENVL